MSADLDRLGERVDRALADVEGLSGEARSRALELKGAIEAFHKGGLAAIVRALKSDPHGSELLQELVQEPEVYALLTLHGLVRVGLEAKVERALDLVRPYLQSHGGEVELVSAGAGVVTVRLLGACDGCSLSARTLRDSVEETLRAQAPEIERVEIAEPEPEPEPDSDSGFVPIESLRRKGPGSGWLLGPALSELEEGKPQRMAVVGGEGEGTGAGVLLLLLEDGRALAYRNACGHQGLPLDGALVDREEGTLTCPWHGYRFDLETGEGLTAPQVRLEALPLRVEGGRILVRAR